MRYAAQRIGTGEWLHRDLPLANVERTRVLSGPGTLSGDVIPVLRHSVATDGLRVLEPWGTYVYALDENDRPVGGGIVIDPSPEEQGTRVTCAGFTTYPQGELYDDATNWGPEAGSGTIEKPETPPPDPIRIVRDLWDWLQKRQDSDLGVTLVGDLKSTRTIGNYEEPFRLRWWESPNIGSVIDDLAGSTPFDYREEYEWAGDTIERRLRIGFPRVGRRRDDLRFVLGENVSLPTSNSESGGDYANAIVGIGNGEGRTMIRADSIVRDGRLRRTRIITDKTVTSKEVMQNLVQDLRERMQSTIDITSIAVRDHESAPLSAIEVGDDIRVETYTPALGDFAMWVRVLSIVEGDSPGAAVLTTQRSDAFTYSATLEVG